MNSDGCHTENQVLLHTDIESIDFYSPFAA